MHERVSSFTLCGNRCEWDDIVSSDFVASEEIENDPDDESDFQEDAGDRGRYRTVSVSGYHQQAHRHTTGMKSVIIWYNRIRSSDR